MNTVLWTGMPPQESCNDKTLNYVVEEYKQVERWWKRWLLLSERREEQKHCNKGATVEKE
jgi:hypothetical protein